MVGEHLKHRNTTGVGAQSTLGEDIFARKLCQNKLQNAPILHEIFPQNNLYIIFAVFFGGGGHVPPCPSHLSVSYAYKKHTQTHVRNRQWTICVALFTMVERKENKEKNIELITSELRHTELYRQITREQYFHSSLVSLQRKLSQSHSR